MAARIASLALVLASTTLASRAVAAEGEPAPADPPRHAIALDVALAPSLGDLGLGAGGFVRYDLRLAPALSLTARAGAIFHPDHAGVDYRASGVELPLLVGARVRPFGHVLYVAADAGAVYVREKLSQPIGESPFTTSLLEPALGLGVGGELGRIDVGLGALAAMPTRSDASGDLLLVATVGVRFASF